MAGLIEVPLEDGGTLVAEIDEAAAEGLVPAGRPGEILGRASKSLEAALETIKPAARSILLGLRDVERPAEVAVEFGLKLTLEAGAIISRTSGEANFKVSLKWQRAHVLE